MIERAVAILPGDDLGVAREFYVGKLGFTVQWEATEDGKNGIMGLQRGTTELTVDCPMSGHGRNVCVSLRVNSADAYYEEWRQRVPMKRSPKDESWGARTFDLTDPFGNTIFVIGPLRGDSEAPSMTRPTISGISPFFIVADVPAALSFYRDMLGFDVVFRGPTPDDEFFGMVRRNGAMIMMKALGVIADGKEVMVEPIPNSSREPAHSWDAYLEVPDPDAVAAEFASRGVPFSVPITDTDDGLRGFEIKDLDGYGLFFGRLRA